MFSRIDLETWPRRDTYFFFKDFADPFFNICANVDVTRVRSLCRQNKLSFSLACLFCSQRAANSVAEFRHRVLGGDVVEFDEIHATQTILNDDQTFSFCYFENAADVFEYDKAGSASRERYKQLRTFDVESDRIDLIYYSVIPWVSFTAFKHASRMDNRQTVPRIVFGMTFTDGNMVKMPVSVEGHHAVMDGIHVGRYFQALQHEMSNLGK